MLRALLHRTSFSHFAAVAFDAAQLSVGRSCAQQKKKKIAKENERTKEKKMRKEKNTNTERNERKYIEYHKVFRRETPLYIIGKEPNEK